VTPADQTSLLALELRTERLELRLPRNHELPALARVAIAGIHPPDFMPFAVAWTDRAAEPTFVDEFIEYHLGHRATWSPEDWSLELGVWANGTLVGVQGMRATSFPRDRRVTTGSWLGAAHQGKGIGTEMRSAALALAFEGLDASTAISGALDGNTVSARVSEKLGYTVAGSQTVTPRGVPVTERCFELTRELWHEHARIDVSISGLEACRGLFGAGEGS